jgi:hypothetical protein
MGDDAHLGQSRQQLEVVLVHPSDFEHVVGAHDDAIPLSLTPAVIDDRGPCSLAGIASLSGAVRVLGRPPSLSQVRLLTFR